MFAHCAQCRCLCWRQEGTLTPAACHYCGWRVPDTRVRLCLGTPLPVFIIQHSDHDVTLNIVPPILDT